MAVIEHRQTYKFAFNNSYIFHYLFLQWNDTKSKYNCTRSHKHKTNLPGNAYSSSHCLNMPSINWYCLDNIQYMYSFSLELITPFKTSLLYNLSWKSNTWNVMPLALTKYLYMMYNIHHINIHNSFYFHCNFFVSFPLTWTQDFHIRWQFSSESSLNSQGVITIKLWLMLAKEAFKCQI